MTTKISTTNIQDTALTTLLGPKISTIVYPGTETATDTNGGETINLTGSGFQSGCSVLVSGTAASVVTFISSTQISFVAPVQTAGTYVIYVINPDGGTAISIPGISYSGTPTWTTSAGSLGTSYETGAISATLTATGDAPITYVLASGTLPTGSTLASNGTLSGTAPATASATTYNFTINAKDAQNQTTSRAFSLTINPDVVTWNSPASLTTYNVNTNTAIANVTMSATSAAGGSITYTADTLPTGLSITGANIAGTPTVVASTTTVLTATATSTRTATRTINWVVTLANDTYWKNVTLLLNGEITVTPFISDASTNSLALTIAGDTKPVLFNPYQGDGYYSMYLNGSSYITVPSSTNAALNFSTGTCIEGWSYITSISSYGFIVSSVQGTGGFVPWWYVGHDNAGNWRCSPGDGTDNNITGYPMTKNVWNHFALTNNGTQTRLFVNGVLIYTKTVTPQNTDQNFTLSQYGPNNQYLITGYVSNIRIIKGSANIPASYVTSSTTIGASIFTPPTTTLTAVTGTSLLIAQSNRFVDKSSNAFTLTLGGSPQISPAIPFTASSSYSTYGSTYFDGTGDYLTMPGSACVFGTNNFTVECWLYPTAYGSGSLFIDNFVTGASFTVGQWQFQLNTNGTVSFFYATSTSAASNITTVLTCPLNTWTHVAISRTGTGTNQTTIYINGVASSSTGTISASIGINATSSIGRQTWSNSYYFPGYISDVRIVNGTGVYTTAFNPPTSLLTAVANTQLLTLQYNGGANNYGIIDNSTFNNIITRNGNATQGTFSPYSQTGFSTYYNGTTDYQTLATNTAYAIGTADFTVEMWVMPTGANLIWSTLFAGVNYGVQSDWGLYASDSNTALYPMFFFTGSSTAGNGASSTQGSQSLTGYTKLVIGQWQHIAVTRISGTAKMFINGTQTGPSVNASTWSLTNSLQKAIAGGYNGNGNTLFTGYISNLRVVSGTGLYSANFTPATTPLTPVAGTILLTNQSNRFIDNSSNNFTLTNGGTPSVQAYSPFGSITEATPTSYSNYFNGSTDYLSITSNTVFAFGTGDFTIEFWAYINNTNRQDFIDIDNGGGYRLLIMYYSNALGYWPANSQQITGPSLTINTWYHIAVVRISGSSKMYVNGTQVGSTYTDSTNYLAQPAYFGHDHAGSTYVTGYMSNLRIVKGVGVYTGNFTTPTNPLASTQSSGINIAAISGTSTSLLTCQSATIVDNSSNALTITVSGSPKVYKYNPFGYTAQTNTSYTPSIHGGSVYFDGNSDYLNLANNTAWSSLSGDFTIECWFYFMNSTQQQQVLFTQRSSSNQYVPYLFWTSNATIVMYSSSNNGSWDIINGTTVVSSWVPQTWNHFAFTRSGSTNRTFFNGVQTYTYTNSSSFTNSGTFNLGMSPGETNTATYGYIADVRLTKTAIYTSNFVPPAQTLTNYSTTYPASLLLNFTNGGIVDQHSSNVLEALGNAQVSTSIKKYNNASIYFDGTGDYLSMPSNQLMNFGTGDFTIEAWVYPNSLAADWFIISASGSGGFFFGFASSVTIGYGWGRAGTAWDYRVASTATTGTWQHVAVTRSGTSMRLFVNGTQAGTTQTIATSYDMSITSTTVGSQGANYYFNGYIDDLRITKGYARYTSNFTAPTSTLITK